MNNRLKSLVDANTEAWARISHAPLSGSGIACPKCDKELHENTSETLTTYPAQRNVWCLSCGYRGLRVI